VRRQGGVSRKPYLEFGLRYRRNHGMCRHIPAALPHFSENSTQSIVQKSGHRFFTLNDAFSKT